MTANYWLNTQLSIAKHTGAIKLDSYVYQVMGSDLIREDWLPIYCTLGRERTIGLLENGTTLDVAKQMCEQIKQLRENQLKLF